MGDVVEAVRTVFERLGDETIYIPIFSTYSEIGLPLETQSGEDMAQSRTG